MTTGQPVQIPTFPELPRDDFIADKNGELTQSWRLYFEQVNLVLQTIIKSEGFVMPSQSATNIALLTGNTSIANIVYDTTNNVFKGNILVGTTPTWKTFTTS